MKFVRVVAEKNINTDKRKQEEKVGQKIKPGRACADNKTGVG